MTVSVVGTSPIDYIDSQGAQHSVPLEALDFSGSTLGIATDWQAALSADAPTILYLAQARVALGDLGPPPTPAPSPALALTATHQGTETNGIQVAVTSDHSKPPLSAPITIQVTETDSYQNLANGTAAVMAIGDDTSPTATKKPGDPPSGTGLVMVKQGSTGASTKVPVALTSTVNAGKSVDLLDADGHVVCTLVPRADYTGTAGIALKVSVDSSGSTFTIAATYDSSKESSTPATVTLTTLGPLPSSVGYLVALTAPSTGAHIPNDSTVTLTGGGPGLSANALLYS